MPHESSLEITTDDEVDDESDHEITLTLPEGGGERETPEESVHDPECANSDLTDGRVDVQDPFQDLISCSQDLDQGNVPPAQSCACCVNPDSADNMIKCNDCRQWLHFACSQLPAYQLPIFMATQRRYTCQLCVNEQYGEQLSDITK